MGICIGMIWIQPTPQFCVTQWPWLMKGVTTNTHDQFPTAKNCWVSISRGCYRDVVSLLWHVCAGFQEPSNLVSPTCNLGTCSAAFSPTLPPTCLPLCLPLCFPAWMVFTVGIHPTVPDWWIDSRAQLNNILRPKNWGLPARMT